MKLMQWVFPNLNNDQYKQTLNLTFWLFVSTCSLLIAMIFGLNTRLIPASAAQMLIQIIGPAIAINMVTLVYLGNQNLKEVKVSSKKDAS